MLSFLSRKSPEKHFISLVISEGKVAASLWKAGGSGQTVLEHAEPVEWHSEAPQSLIDSSDVVLEHLGPQVNSVKEVLLGLPETWSSGQSIAPDKKSLLHNLAKQLNLKSVGFVVVPEAVAALFRDRERTGLNALLVYVSEKNLQVMLLVHGKAEGLAKVGRSDSLSKDVIEACARAEFRNIPGRILLASIDLSEAEMTSAQQEMQSMQWKEGLFLHHPRVDLVPPEMILDAVSLSGGREVAVALGIMKGEKDVDQVEQEDEGQEDLPMGFSPVNEREDEQSNDGEEEGEEDGKVDVGLSEMPRKTWLPKPLIILFGVILGLGILTILGYFALAQGTTALVELKVKTQPIQFETDLVIDASASETNPAAGILKATVRTKEVSDTSEAISTGSKTIGDKAVGQVTIYNRTTVGEKLFKAGTILKLDDKVQFTLDADVTVPVGTPDNGLVGKASAKVTAVNFGAESNIAKAVQLSIGGFDQSSFYALTDDAFIGGTSRKVQVVSDTDQKKLADTLFAFLKQKALDSFNSESAPNENIVLSENVVVTKRQFSDDIGKEVKSFTLTMTVTATGIVYTNEDLSAFAELKLASQIPPGARMNKDETEISINNQKSLSETKSLVNASIVAKIVPPLDEEQFAGLLAGKTIEDANSFLSSQTSLESYRITTKPYFALNLFRKLPSENKISVVPKVE